ncbi:hypothetical protein [Priestia aryabhattai]|uniref:hypothetical protein n=1 Tax=Priestia aryabhattai TaxID=412384 RepID=UPI001873EDFE|nr:hypothetical protein [Priestia aryabhattai]MBE5098482.1 hypothetical protein [Priestia aryabhattai]
MREFSVNKPLDGKKNYLGKFDNDYAKHLHLNNPTSTNKYELEGLEEITSTKRILSNIQGNIENDC